MSKKISILAEQFMYFDLKQFQSGGGESYLHNLVILIKKLGYDVDVYQFSFDKNTPDGVKYNNFYIKGLRNIVQGEDYNISLNRGIQNFYEATQKSDYYIFLTMNLVNIKPPKKSILISHGIYFDFDSPTYKQPMWNDMVKRWFRDIDCIVSCDTNTVNYIRTYFPRFIDKTYLISNYADQSLYKPENRIDDGKFKVLYPRRLHSLRGFSVLQSAIDILNIKYADQMYFTFCGRGLGNAEKEMAEWCLKRPNCNQISHDLGDMYKEYNNHDLVVIPTVASEGTSISAIEAISCAKPLITTDVGGLNDICIDDFNGLKIRASQVEELIYAIEYAYLHPDDMKRWSINALELSKSFSKQKWDSKWENILNKIFNN